MLKTETASTPVSVDAVSVARGPLAVRVLGDTSRRVVRCWPPWTGNQAVPGDGAKVSGAASGEGPARRASALRKGSVVLVTACALLLSACSLKNAGATAPSGEINYPTGAILSGVSAEAPDSGAARYLVLANSNFTLRYNAGSLQVLDLDKLTAQLETTTDGAPGCLATSVPATCEAGRSSACCFDDASEFLVPGGELPIDSYAMSLAGEDPLGADGRGRVYAAVRASDRVLYVDVSEQGRLACAGAAEACAISSPDASVIEEASLLGASIPEPQALRVVSGARMFPEQTGDASGALGSASLAWVGHRAGGLRLLADDPRDSSPRVVSDIQGVVGGVTALAFDPVDRLMLVSSLFSDRIQRVGVVPDMDGGTLFAAAPLDLVATSLVQDTGDLRASDIRDLHVDPDDPRRLHALVRGPQASTGLGLQSVVFLERDAEDSSRLRYTDAVRVGYGPARLEHIRAGGRAYLLVSCFEAGEVHVVDVVSRRTVAIVRGMDGPYAMAYDGGRGLLFVVDFASSTLRVVDLRGVADPALPAPRVVATIGRRISQEAIN